ncbi:MAG: PAC2 family protein [Actinomycetia bacterium]|nr:PAC2 family protein [Actinomycetes bacterium]
MSRVNWRRYKPLGRPTAVVAYRGWGDAGEASSRAVDHVLSIHPSVLLEEIDAEEYFDFQVLRPEIRFAQGGSVSLTWPSTKIYLTTPPGESPLLVITGDEPHARWKTYVRQIMDLCRAAGVEKVLTMGAFMGQVAHTLPVPMVGRATHPDQLHRHGLFGSNYQGPTGIVGVLHQAFTQEGWNALTLWAAVPHYLSTQEYPPASLALVEKASQILGIDLQPSPLEMEVSEFRDKLEAVIAESEDLAGYIKHLEEELSQGDDLQPEDLEDARDQMISEIEEFLRRPEN